MQSEQAVTGDRYRENFYSRQPHQYGCFKCRKRCSCWTWDWEEPYSDCCKAQIFEMPIEPVRYRGEVINAE